MVPLIVISSVMTDKRLKYVGNWAEQHETGQTSVLEGVSEYLQDDGESQLQSDYVREYRVREWRF
jgi:hypothetical protein